MNKAINHIEEINKRLKEEDWGEVSTQMLQGGINFKQLIEEQLWIKFMNHNLVNLSKTHLILKAFAQEFIINNNIDTDPDDIFRIDAGECRFIIQLLNNEIVHVFTNPFWLIDKAHIDITSIKQFYKMRLLFEILDEIEIIPFDEEIVDLILSYSKIFEFYPALIYKDDSIIILNDKTTIFDPNKAQPKFCLESGNKLGQGFFKDSKTFRNFSKNYRHNGKQKVLKLFYTDVLLFNKKLDSLLDVDLYLGDSRVVDKLIDKCKGNISKKIKKAINNKGKTIEEGYIPQAKVGISTILNHIYKASFAITNRIVDDDEKITGLETIFFSGLQSHDHEMIGVGNYEGVDFTSFIDNSIEIKNLILNAYGKIIEDFVKEYGYQESQAYDLEELDPINILDLNFHCEHIYPNFNLLRFHYQKKYKNHNAETVFKPLPESIFIFYKNVFLAEFFNQCKFYQKNATSKALSKLS